MIPASHLMLLHLAGHSAFHGNTRLLWLFDIRRFVDHARSSLNWVEFVRCAKDWHLSLPMLRVLERVSVLFGPVSPAWVLDDLRSHGADWRDRLTLDQAPRDATSPVSHFLTDLICTPGILFKLGYARRVVCPGVRHLAQTYPFRHRGWLAAALAWRSLGAVRRAANAPGHAALRALGRAASLPVLRSTL